MLLPSKRLVLVCDRMDVCLVRGQTVLSAILTCSRVHGSILIEAEKDSRLVMKFAPAAVLTIAAVEAVRTTEVREMDAKVPPFDPICQGA